MKIPVTLWPALLILTIHIHSVSSQCLDNHKSLLLDLQSILVFNHTTSTKLARWNQRTDCCKWSGVKCNSSNGQVIGLDLSNEAISSGIDNNSSSLFRLQSLQSLNLAFNPVSGKTPSGLCNLSSLTYLNLSNTGFSGQVPIEISQLVNLVILDISMPQYAHNLEFSPLYIKSPNLDVIIRNLTNIRELHLDGVAVSAEENNWGEALSSSLPHLQVLSMFHCNLTGEIHPSLATLRSLSVISLDFNNLSAPVPDFLVGFTNLTTLTLSSCGLIGTFPQKIFEVPTLTTLELSENDKLQGTLPQSISKRLRTIDLFICNFHGTIPPSMGSLNQLEYVDLSFNNFSGPIPYFSPASNLYFLELSYNSLTGSIPTLPSTLQYLGLYGNNLEGPIPKSIYQSRGLELLVLGKNRFNGTLELQEFLHSLNNLLTLDLSHNCLSIDVNDTTANSSLPLLSYLGLASGNLHVLPEFLKNQPYLYYLDLSNNQIQGKVPTWIWKDGINSLNLSCNNFMDLEGPLPQVPNLQFLDLHSNNLPGQIPAIPSQRLQYLDCSNNSFTSINPNFSSSISSLQFVSLSRNEIYGSIPTSFCNATTLEVLNLEYNYLTGTIPACLIASQSLVVLNLRENKLHGTILDEFGKRCTLETLNLNKNFLQGQIPRSVANCKELKVLDLGNNVLTGTFPCHLKSLSSLQVLVLRSNKFHGTVVCQGRNLWSLLQIVDLASNHFRGQLSTLFLGNWRMMMASTNKMLPKLDYLQFTGNSSVYYQDQVAVTFKGSEFVLQKILTIFASIDLSNNAFHGEVPRELGNLVALKVLNLSHNSLSGSIPPSMGNLSQLESLDLSCNTLSGRIPQQLVNLNFLGYLNMSFNKLSGKIPTGTQLQSFDATSYEGNPGLYGPPLTSSDKTTHAPGSATSPTGSHYWSSDKELESILSGAVVGLPVGIIIFIGPLLYIKRWRQWYYYQVDRLIVKIMTPVEKLMDASLTPKPEIHEPLKGSHWLSSVSSPSCISNQQ